MQCRLVVVIVFRAHQTSRPSVPQRVNMRDEGLCVCMCVCARVCVPTSLESSQSSPFVPTVSSFTEVFRVFLCHDVTNISVCITLLYQGIHVAVDMFRTCNVTGIDQ